MIGLSTSGSISFGCAFVAGKESRAEARGRKDDLAHECFPQRWRSYQGTAFGTNSGLSVWHSGPCIRQWVRSCEGLGRWALCLYVETPMLDLVFLRDRIDDARTRLRMRGPAAALALDECAAVDVRWRQQAHRARGAQERA